MGELSDTKNQRLIPKNYKKFIVYYFHSIKSISFFLSRKQNGHFTQIVRDESDRIGCAISKYQSDGFYHSYLVCNYGVTNILNEPIYKSGSTASGCKSGRNQMYVGLCNTNEMYY